MESVLSLLPLLRKDKKTIASTTQAKSPFRRRSHVPRRWCCLLAAVMRGVLIFPNRNTTMFRTTSSLQGLPSRRGPHSGVEKGAMAARWGSKNETLIQAFVMVACCLASGSAFSVGVRTAGLRRSPARIVRTPGSALFTGCRRQARAGVVYLLVACNAMLITRGWCDCVVCV